MAIKRDSSEHGSSTSLYQADDARLNLDAFAIRLQDLIGGRTIISVAEESGISESSLRSALKAGGEMGRDRLISLARTLETTVEYLATGQHPFQSSAKAANDPDSVYLGVMSYNELLTDVRPQKQGEQGKLRQLLPTTRGMPRFKIGLTKSFFEEHHVQPGNVRVVMCQGDAMEPFIKNGDYLMVDVTPHQPVMEGVYLLMVSNSLTLRRLAATPAGLTAVPDNARYQPFKVTLDEDGFISEESVEPIGRVFWVLRGVTP